MSFQNFPNCPRRFATRAILENFVQLILNSTWPHLITYTKSLVHCFTSPWKTEHRECPRQKLLLRKPLLNWRSEEARLTVYLASKERIITSAIYDCNFYKSNHNVLLKHSVTNYFLVMVVTPILFFVKYQCIIFLPFLTTISNYK